MKTFNTAEEVIAWSKSQTLYSLSVNGEEAVSFWTRDDGALILSSEFATIAVFSPFECDYLLVSDFGE